jgi:hypothetical protein
MTVSFQVLDQTLKRNSHFLHTSYMTHLTYRPLFGNYDKLR